LPLLAIADLIGAEWPQLARAAASKFSLSAADDGSNSVQLLSDIQKIFDERGVDKVFSEELAIELGKMEDRPWPEWKNGKPISKSQIARILGTKFDIAVKTVRIGTETATGYKLDQFDDVFLRYLGSQNVTRSQPTPVMGEFRKSRGAALLIEATTVLLPPI